MSSSLNQNDNTHSKTSSHESGALAAWSMIGGGILGGLIGLFFHQPWFGMITLGAVAWIVGALIDRSRR